MTIYRGHGFSSKMPSGWVDRSTITLMGPTAPDGFGANLVVTRQPLPSGTSATAWATEQLAGLPDEVDAFEPSDQRAVVFGGRPLYQSLHRIRIGERWIHQVQTYLVVERGAEAEGFVITGSASPLAFDAAMPMFKQFTEALSPSRWQGGRGLAHRLRGRPPLLRLPPRRHGSPCPWSRRILRGPRGAPRPEG